MPIELLDAGERAQVAQALMDRFAAMHGRSADACYAAPGRVNLIGEHVDYNGGRCLPAALPHATYAAVSVRDDDTVTVSSLQVDEPWRGTLSETGPGQVDGWAAYAVGVLWALREDGLAVPGLDLVIDSRVPVGAGLSSSAALECAVALAACAAAGVSVDPGLDDAWRDRVVAACVRAENEVAGAATGGLDQNIAVRAEAGHALLLDFADGSRRQVPWDPTQAELELLVVDTRVHHSLNDGGYASRRADCEEASRILGVPHLAAVTDADAALDALPDGRLRKRVRHVLSELTRVDAAVRVLDEGDPERLGELLDGSHASLRDDYEVSCDELDVVVETAVDNGALGARMTGGGFGGSAIALVPVESARDVEEAVAAAFEVRGWAAPGLLRAEAGPGARRVL